MKRTDPAMPGHLRTVLDTRPLLPKPRGLFAKSNLDALLVTLSICELAATFALAGYFQRLPWAVKVGWAMLLVFANCTNYQCIAHNFIHNPFFRAKGLNRCFGVLNTLALGIPQNLYKVHHLNHHKYGSDLNNGTTADYSSIYRFSTRPPLAETLWRYAFIGPLRADFRILWRDARRLRLHRQILWETLALLLFWLLLLSMNSGFFLFIYLPLWYLGQVAAYAENYLEHYKAMPGSPLTDSVSCYNTIYNRLWFNNGYHQEHHLKPSVHWSRVKEIRRAMLPENQRRVVGGAHWFNF